MTPDERRVLAVLTPLEVAVAEVFDLAAYVCGRCHHAGGEHGLNNRCLVCDCDHFSEQTGAENTAFGIAALRDRGYSIISTLALKSLVSAANVGLTPTGEHRLIEGYCPDCQGSCLIGFGNA